MFKVLKGVSIDIVRVWIAAQQIHTPFFSHGRLFTFHLPDLGLDHMTCFAQ